MRWGFEGGAWPVTVGGLVPSELEDVGDGFIWACPKMDHSMMSIDGSPSTVTSFKGRVAYWHLLGRLAIEAR